MPMTDDVKECFARILQNRPKSKKEPMINGKTGFLYLDKNGMPMGCSPLGKVFPAYQGEVQQDIQSPDAVCHSQRMQAYFLFQYGKVGNEPEDPTENYGTQRYRRYYERAYPR